MGEFGRTPKISTLAGQKSPAATTGRRRTRSPSPAPASGAARTIGQTDKIGAYPVTRAYSPADLSATIYEALGIDPATEVRDRLGRPIQLTRGSVIAPLYA